MKTILLPVEADYGLESRLAAALDLARACGGRLICLHVVPFVPVATIDPAGVEAARATAQLEESTRAYRVQMEGRLGTTGVPFEWRNFQGDPASTIISQSRLADVVVLSRPAHPPPSRDPLPSINDVAVHARAPVLAVPTEGKRFDPHGPALVAWNGSHEAAAALRASVALLKIAPAVHIVTVSTEPVDFPASSASDYLAGHGIASTFHHRPGDRSVPEALVVAAGELSAGYIVGGAYGHSRIRELLLGGVTQWMLRQSPVTLLLSH